MLENWSLALLEGLACGLPIISVPTGGIPDLLRDVDQRFLAASTDPTDIAAQVGEITAAEDLDRIRARSRAVAADRYDWEIVVDRLVDVMRDVAADRQISSSRVWDRGRGR